MNYNKCSSMPKPGKENIKGILTIIVILVFSGCAKEESEPVTQLLIEETIILDSGTICMVVSFPGEINEWTAENIERNKKGDVIG